MRLANRAYAETVTISDRTTTSDKLTGVVAATVARLAKRAGTPRKLIPLGDLAPSTTVKIQWWGDHRLTISFMTRSSMFSLRVRVRCSRGNAMEDNDSSMPLAKHLSGAEDCIESNN